MELEVEPGCARVKAEYIITTTIRIGNDADQHQQVGANSIAYVLYGSVLSYCKFLPKTDRRLASLKM